MARTKSWEISKLSIKQDLTSAAKVILYQRLDNLLASIKDYLVDITPENLHQVRISLRRVRYSMELFLKCFNRKKYMSFYKIISSLQDVSGEIRDLDILKQSLQRFGKKYNLQTEEINFSKIDIEKNQFQSRLELELMKFVHRKELRSFKKLINSHI